MKAFKGFNEDLTCRGFQYQVGETYEYGGTVRVCGPGFHAVTFPLDVFHYYPPGNSVFRTVELDCVVAGNGGDSTVAARKITVGDSLTLAGLVRAHVEAVFDLVENPSTGRHANAVTMSDYVHAATTSDHARAATAGNYSNAATTGNYANAATTGRHANAVTTSDHAHAATTGYYSNAATTGYYSNAVTTGHSAHAVTTGDYADAVTTGDHADAATTGYSAHAVTTGYSSHATTTGDHANAATTGYSTKIRASVKDENSIAAVLGRGAAKGVEGSWLVLTERDDDWNILGVKAVQVDGKKVKADTFYALSGRKVTEVAS